MVSKSMIRFQLSLGFVVATILVFGGCSGNSVKYPTLASVTGTVTLDGQPLEGATVTFVPATGRASSGLTDASGYYSLQYTKTIAGATLGQHRVMIQKMVADRSHKPTAIEKLMDAETNAMLAETGIPLVIGDTKQPADPAGPQPLKPILVSAVADRFYGPDTELTAEVTRDRNVLNFDVTSD